MSDRRPDITSWDEFIRETKMLPDGREPKFNITSPLEQHLFGVADKHGVMDQVLNEDFNEDY